MAIFKKIISVGEDVKEGKSCVLGEIVKWFSHMENSVEIFFLNRTIICSINSSIGCLLDENKNTNSKRY